MPARKVGPFVQGSHFRPRLGCFIALLAALLLSEAIYGQSTFGTVLGTVKESSGAVVPGALVTLTNTGTNAKRSTMTGDTGTYQFVNVEVGNYRVTVEAAGFQKAEFTQFDLGGRETKRLDAGLTIASQTTTVNVEASAGAIETDTSSIAETKGSRELTDLPVAITSRSTGSTSAMSTLTAQSGVQTDASGNISVAGTLPSQLSMSIDGISSMGTGSAISANAVGALSELFPSFNAIEEIRIGETINPAEFGGVADITTISKAGSNHLHGGVFENFQNSYTNAADFFSHIVNEVKMNNFGIYMGGPVVLPKLYNGHDKTFFFGSFEVLRLPKSQTEIESVPTVAMREGDLSAYLSSVNGGAANQLTGYPGNIIPASMLSAYSQRVLSTFYPLPNYGPPGAVANNYLANFPIPINSAQGDARVDQMIGSKHLVFARYTYKNRRVEAVPVSPAFANPGTPSLPTVGENSVPEVDGALTVAWNFTISPSLVNELRGGFSETRQASTYGISAQGTANALGLTGLPQTPPVGANIIPQIEIAGFAPLGDQSGNANQGTKQLLETLTWTNGKHTMKFGGDYRRLHAYFNAVFYNLLEGAYTFNGSVMSSLLGPGSATPIASFLLGYPDNSTIATNLGCCTYAMAEHYAAFVQDDYKVSKDLTLNYGLRYEYHPTFRDKYNNLANLDPDYLSVVNGQTVRGAVIVPGPGTLGIVDPGFAQSIAPTPIITAQQAGLPAALRYSQKTDFAPRFGFAWRMFGNDKTVLRGGYGRYIEALMSSAAISAWGVEASDVGFFNNSFGSSGQPVFQLPYSWPSNIAQPGSQSFFQVTDLHYKDPYVQEWNLTVERDLGAGFGLRVSYDGNHASNLGTSLNLNQPPANTTGFANLTAANFPFPLWQEIYYNTNDGFANYNAMTAAVNKRLSNGLQLQASYIYARNLSNLGGNPSTPAGGFAGEYGGQLSNPYQPGIDYGNVNFTRRNRFLTTFLYDLPFGKGKLLLNSANGFVDRVVNGWELAGVLLFQTGPFMTVSQLNDPCGCGYNVFSSTGGRADTVPGVNPYAGQSIGQWINPAAFATPPNNIGRFGDASAGSVVGPGTEAVSMSLIKSIPIRESVRAQVGVQVANLFNHPNFAAPQNLTLGVAGFGQLTALQSAEGAGPRQIQLTGRITF
ncbi:MAG TPA: carboxypeptidase-like regulatory domain-containing protein [Bryobacteraceae bacterium]|nr:carboxypeptidase-like regulatory domain-containing protein [Bryobacteraceae bacterium]